MSSGGSSGVGVVVVVPIVATIISQQVAVDVVL